MRPSLHAGLGCLVIALAACDAAPTNEVFTNYDVRHPAPVAIPRVDNDYYYSQPNCSGGFDAPGCVSTLGKQGTQ